MEFENPYVKFIECNQKEKEAIVNPLKASIPKDVLGELNLPDNNVRKKRVKKQYECTKSSPYQMRTRIKREAKAVNFQPLRRISPRIAKQERRSLEEEYLADQTMVASIEEKYPRKPEGPLRLQDYVQHVDKESWERHVSGVGRYLPPVTSDTCHNISNEAMNKKGKDRWLMDALEGKGTRMWVYPKKGTEGLDRFKERVSKLSMWCGSMARVLLERVTSLAIHPSKDKLIVAVGGKKGSLGLWIVSPTLNSEVCVMQSDESATGLYRFEPHSGQINCISFCTFRADRLFTSSYDGTVRSLNFERLVFDELLSSPRDVRNNWMQWHCQLSPNVLLVSQGTGNVYVVDDRTNREHEAILKCYDRSCRTVSIHPLHTMYLATSSSLGLVSIWDLRKFGRNGASISQMSIPGRMQSAFFSPVTGSGLLATASDQLIRIYDTSKLEEGIQSPAVFRVETDIKHHHKTWLWITPIRATWLPQRDDAFVVGSLANPRRVEVFGRHGRMFCNLGMNGHFPINTVCPVNAFHPSRMLLASADSGGRVHLLL